MAQKKSPAELKAEADAISAHIALARKRPLNFALLIGKEGLVLEAHMTKGPDVMRRAAKAAGGGPKGAMGVMNVSGKVMELTCVDEDAPRNLTKLAKKFFAERGITMKVVMLLPGGERVGEDDDDGAETDAPEAAETATEAEAETEDATDPSADVQAALKERLAGLVPGVRALAAKNAALSEKLGKGLKAAAGELQAEGYEKAEKLLDALEKALADAANAGPDPEALRAKLKEEYAAAQGSLEKLKAEASKAVGGKADQLAKMFEGLVSGEDLKKAGAVLSLIKTFVQSETAKLAENTGSLFDRISDAVGEIADDVGEALEDAKERGEELVEDLGEALEDAKEMAEDFVESLTPAGRAKQELERLGFSEAEAEKIAAELEKNPNAVKEAKAKLVDEAKLDPTQTAMLKKLADSDPKSFEAAMTALKSMDADGKDDISPANMQASLDAFEVARKASVAALAEQVKADAAQTKAAEDIAKSGAAVTKADSDVAATTKALADFMASLPDAATMTDKERNAAAAQSNKLINAREDARKALEKAKTEQAKAAQDKLDADKARGDADKKVADAKGPLDAATEANDKLEAKKDMLDALAFGPLSPGAKPAMSDEDKASFVATFAKDGKLAKSAMDLAQRSDDPSLIARNVGFIADKMGDGFAAPDGKKLDLSKDDSRAMAQNALRMGSLQGEEYFTGFKDYLESGKQLEPDPNGGMDEPLVNPDAEELRLKKVALNRTAAMGSAALNDEGKVDFGSDAAKGAMDHMMFHPGSLKTFTPQMNQKMVETKALFENGATSGKANAVIDKTKLPGATAPGRTAAMDIVGRTSGKAPGDVTDKDAKASVLSAMMTPLSQGPVGSCFSTAPVRAIRETDPIRAMGAYSDIASTGQFKAADGFTIPANRRAPQNENPLMRSWEYSVATVAQQQASSAKRKDLNKGLFPGTTPAKGLDQIKAIMPGKWADPTVPNPATGLFDEGIKTKLEKAIQRQLVFEYNAGMDATGTAGGGDGSSTNGVYEIFFNGNPIRSDDDFKAAMKAISLGAAGVAEDSEDGKKIVALVTGQPFINDILASYGPPPTDPKVKRTAPWNLGGGGLETTTGKILNGGNPRYNDISVVPTPPGTVAQRTQQLLGDVVQAHKTMAGDMVPMGTTGTGAMHAFNTMPNHPSLDKIKDPNSAAKIQSELIAPGQAIANGKLTTEETAATYEDIVRETAEGFDQANRDLIMSALKTRPTTSLSPAEIKKAITDEVAKALSDDYLAKNEPGANPARKAEVLTFYKGSANDWIGGKIGAKMTEKMRPPEVVISDTNWGDASSQIQFVIIPDASSGDLVLYKKDVFSGKLTPAGDNWANAKWDTVKG